MFKLPIYTIAGLALALNPLQAYDKDLETLYPESTMLYGRVDNITKLSKIDKDHPISNLLNNKAFKSYLMGAIGEDSEESEMKEEVLGFLTKHCRDRASLGLLNIGIGKDNKETTNSLDSQNVQVGLNLNNLSGGATIDCTATVKELEALFDFIKEKSPEIENIINDEFEGVPYWIIEGAEPELPEDAPEGAVKPKAEKSYIALTDELLIITNKEVDLKDFIGKVIAPSKEKTLADNPKYLDVAQKLKKYDLSAYARLDQVYKILIENEETSLLNYIDENPQLKMFISRKAVQKDLHLDAFDSAFWGAKLTEEGGDLKSGYSVVSKEGIANLFQYDKNIPEIPQYAFEGFKSMSVSSYDFGGNFKQLEKLVSKVSPTGYMFATNQFGEIYTLAKTNFFENIEPYYVTLSGHIDAKLETERGASKVHVFKVKNAERIHELVAKIREEEFGKGITTIDFMGEKVYKMPADSGLSYYAAVVKNFLVVTETSEDAMWRHVISQIKNPGKTITSHKALMDMWDTMKGEEVARSYTDVGQMILDGYFEQKRMMDEIGEPMDDDMPDVKDLNYSLVSKFYQEENFWYSEMKLKDYSPHKK